MDQLPFILIFLAIVAFVWLLSRLSIKPKQASKTERPRDAFGTLTHSLAYVFPIRIKKKEELSFELVKAGHYNSNATSNFLARRNVSVMVCLAFIGWILATEHFPTKDAYVCAVGIALAILIYSLPRLILSARAKRRSQQIELALPDALDMVSMSVEGGVPLQRSLKLVAVEFRQTHVPLAEELQIIARQTETGSLETAMKQFAKRMELPEVVAWSAMLAQSQRLGVRMVDAMRDYADRIRENRKQKAELAGQTATVKLLLPVVLCLAPPIFILLIGPAILDFREFINREKNNGAELIQEVNDQQEVALKMKLQVTLKA